MLPGQVKPLIWSINIPLVNGAWVKLFKEIAGVKGIDPLELARAFHYRAYFNMGEVGRIFEQMGLPRSSLEIMMSGKGKIKMRFEPKMMAIAPRAALFVLSKINIRHEIDRFIAKAEPHYDRLIKEDLSSASETDLLERSDDLFRYNEKAAYYNILSMLFAQIYARALQKREALAEHYNWSTSDGKYVNAYPHKKLEEMRKAIGSLPPEVRMKVETSKCSELEEIEEAAMVSSLLREYLSKYGHYSESGNDFSKVPWREDPEIVWKLVLAMDTTDGKNIEKTRSKDVGRPSISGFMIRGIGRKTALFSDLRERMGSTYTKGYGIFRRYYLEIGKRFSEKGLIEVPEDIFYLYLEEIRSAIHEGRTEGLKDEVMKRKDEMARTANVLLPEVIYGEDPPPFETCPKDILSGIPSSGGYYRGKAKVVRGIGDFAKVAKGDIIIIPFSDVSWSSVFAKAGAVVSESGGMLSHSSIVAREFGIPAVVSVKHAMNIEDGSMVVVDGYTGKVVLEGISEGP